MPECSVCGNALMTEMQSLQAQLAALQAVAKAAERYKAARDSDKGTPATADIALDRMRDISVAHSELTSSLAAARAAGAIA